jgi:hypothetical protein
VSTYAIEHCFSQILHLTMSATPPVGTPGTMSVTHLIASMQRDMTKAPPPATVAAADLQGTQLMYYEEQILGSSPAVKVEREGALGKFGLPGGVSMACHWCFSLREMDKDSVWVELGVKGCACCRREYAAWRSMIKKLVAQEAMVHIMAPATKQTKFAAYEAPALAAASLTSAQYEDLTQEQHPVADWNRIILAINAVKFDTEKDYEEIKLRASKNRIFSQAFTPRKKVKFAMEGAIAGMQAVDLEASSEIRTLLKPRLSVSEGAAHSLTEQEWEAVCTYVQLLSTRIPELQEILFASNPA